jgi:phosphinothricin acetyltransferase
MKIMNTEPLKQEDYEQVKEIYLEGIATGNATFETNAPEWEEWDKNHLKHSRIVIKNGEEVIGWAALSTVSGRCVYGGVAEVSVYVKASEWGKGIGKTLLAHLIEESENNNIWTLQAGIFPENLSSIKIHKDSGFREVGFREKIGKMNDTWRDIILLERRSERIGR